MNVSWKDNWFIITDTHMEIEILIILQWTTSILDTLTNLMNMRYRIFTKRNDFVYFFIIRPNWSPSDLVFVHYAQPCMKTHIYLSQYFCLYLLQQINGSCWYQYCSIIKSRVEYWPYIMVIKGFTRFILITKRPCFVFVSHCICQGIPLLSTTKDALLLRNINIVQMWSLPSLYRR